DYGAMNWLEFIFRNQSLRNLTRTAEYGRENEGQYDLHFIELYRKMSVLHGQAACVRAFHRKNPVMIFPARIICMTSVYGNQRTSMRSSSIGVASPAVKSVARKIVIRS